MTADPSAGEMTMVHPCAACGLRFRSSGELTDHIATDHVEHPILVVEHSRPPRAALDDRAYTRSGWAVVTAPRTPETTDPG